MPTNLHAGTSSSNIDHEDKNNDDKQSVNSHCYAMREFYTKHTECFSYFTHTAAEAAVCITELLITTPHQAMSKYYYYYYYHLTASFPGQPG